MSIIAQGFTAMTGDIRDTKSSPGLCLDRSHGISVAFHSTAKKFISTLHLRPRQNGRHFADDIFKCIFLNENASIAIKISLKFVPTGPINNIPALVQILAWRQATSHYPNQWWSVYRRIYASLGPNELTCLTRLVISGVKNYRDIFFALISISDQAHIVYLIKYLNLNVLAILKR